MKKLAIFDLDGTLLNTIADLAASTNYALKHYNYPTHDEEAYKFFVGNGINKLFERALPDTERTQDNIMKIRSVFVPYYDKHNADLSKPYDGINDLLKTLTENNIGIAVASNKYHSATKKLINQFFGDFKFISVLGQRDGIPAKPDPTIIHDIEKETGVSKEHIIYIGDSCVDMETGKNAGVITVGVSWGFRPRTELEKYNPDFIADNCSELKQFILNIKI